MRREYPADPRECHACPARAGCFLPVLPAGRVDAEILVVGEFPDPASHATGETFSIQGDDGPRLSWLLAQVGVTEAEVRRLYAVRCHVPPEPGGRFRPAEREWVEACRYWLAREIDASLAAYAARPDRQSERPALITLGFRPFLAIMGVGPWEPHDWSGHWHRSLLFSALEDQVFAMPALLTLREGTRTPAIEALWREAISRLWRGLGILKKLPEAVEEADFDQLPSCGGTYKSFTPCKCDAMRQRWLRCRRQERQRDTNVYTDAHTSVHGGSLEG